jgi:LPXTG-site transpeptidase (sortase) family protein
LGRLQRMVRQADTRPWLLLGSLLLVAALYVLTTALAPALPLDVQPHVVAQKVQITPPKPRENRLYIPAINVDVPVIEGEGKAALEKGAWHRKPENGNPEKGGNFVLSAHRFQMGFTPQQTREKSPFYRIDQLRVGEKMYVDYNNKRYTYEVVKKYAVDRHAVSIEAPSTEPKMTLYSCDLKGEAAGRQVIEAKAIL